MFPANRGKGAALRTAFDVLFSRGFEAVVTVDADGQHLPEEIQASKENAHTLLVTLGTSLEQIEKDVIQRTLAEVTNHRENAAKLLGISLRTLQYKIKEYGIRA